MQLQEHAINKKVLTDLLVLHFTNGILMKISVDVVPVVKPHPKSVDRPALNSRSVRAGFSAREK